MKQTPKIWTHGRELCSIKKKQEFGKWNQTEELVLENVSDMEKI